MQRTHSVELLETFISEDGLEGMEGTSVQRSCYGGPAIMNWEAQGLLANELSEIAGLCTY